MDIKVGDIIKNLEKTYPKRYAESWDNVGLLVGSSSMKVKKIQISLDVTEGVIDRAIENNVDLIIAHHPMIFSKIGAINDSTILGKKILKLIENKIAVYVAHTNLDSAPGGLNKYIAKKIGFNNLKTLLPKKEERVLLTIRSTDETLNEVKNLIEEKHVIERSDDSLTIKMKTSLGRGNQLLNTLGVKGLINKEESYIVDIYEKVEDGGIGYYTTLDKEVSVEEYAREIKKKLSLKNLRIVRSNKKEKINKVGVINGSGMGLYKSVKSAKLDLLLTGDIKYHEGLDAREDGINLIDIGHYESESFFHELVEDNLSTFKELEIENYNDMEIFEYL